ncbi:hypothetical protein RSOL_111570 [Rhizoctonia solani AG-3 Rhs1AP]|uniref:Uncharacterized protein n=1 Tax=Rhizoctonia solani AG-3 Rhs1AP TaxID=1086054 RepID=X8J231_9AGAM|nr:hypothetical protein RSOL_111570 [Rhizoctonia solani AG-3 Rhs1AP]
MGLIELLSCITPSPFAHEYGYVCFRTLVLSFNVCLLKHNGACKNFLDEILNGNRDQKWTEDLDSVSSAIPCFEPTKLKKLLSILHSDQKNFLIILRDTVSLGLSGPLFILRYYVVSQRHVPQPTQLCCYIFSRYLVTVPDFGDERIVAGILLSPEMILLRKEEQRVDLDELGSVIQTYIDSTRSGYRGRLKICYFLPLSLIAPRVVPGCEYLVPSMFEATIQVLWESLMIGR